MDFFNFFPIKKRGHVKVLGQVQWSVIVWPQSRVSSVKFPEPKSCTIYSMVGWPDLNLRNPRYSPHRGSNQGPLDLEASGIPLRHEAEYSKLIELRIFEYFDITNYLEFYWSIHNRIFEYSNIRTFEYSNFN